MANLTLCYSTHRPETLELTAGIMKDFDTIILEDPPHHDFDKVLSGDINLQDHLLELDLGYPEFTQEQYRLIKQFHLAGKKIVQIEPYLEYLLQIQYFLAEEQNTPEDIVPNTVMHSVYCAERAATGTLIDYYKAVTGNKYSKILSTMNAFAKADAARFILRDTLRVKQIVMTLDQGKNTYIEAGSIHILLYKLITKSLPENWSFHSHSIDRDILKITGLKGNLLSPGDTLTLRYIFDQKVEKKKWQLLCSQSIIYSKIIRKEEIPNTNGEYPHTLNELEAISIVNQLSAQTCRKLFQRIRLLTTENAAEEVRNYCGMKKLRAVT